MDPSDLLYTNQFISEKPITIENINRNSENYYNFIKTKRNVNKPIKDYLLNDQLTNQKINKNLKNNWPSYNNNKSPVLSSTIEDVTKNDYSKRYLTSVVIDSRDRDLNTNISPNNYTINLPKQFQNIEKIEVKDIQLKNNIPVINETNNTFSWSYPSQGDTLECINNDKFLRNKFIRGQVPEYILKRNSPFLINDINQNIQSQ